MIFCLKQKLRRTETRFCNYLQSQKLIALSIVDSKNNFVLQYDLNIYATLAKICQAATFLAHVKSILLRASTVENSDRFYKIKINYIYDWLSIGYVCTAITFYVFRNLIIFLTKKNISHR
jgi:hypothetical protein